MIKSAPSVEITVFHAMILQKSVTIAIKGMGGQRMGHAESAQSILLIAMITDLDCL